MPLEALSDKELIEQAKAFAANGEGKGDRLLFRICKRLEAALLRIAKLERRERKHIALERDLKFRITESGTDTREKELFMAGWNTRNDYFPTGALHDLVAESHWHDFKTFSLGKKS